VHWKNVALNKLHPAKAKTIAAMRLLPTPAIYQILIANREVEPLFPAHVLDLLVLP